MADVSCPVIVGRVEEQARLRAALAEAKAGRGGTLFVVGEAGMGKSRLVSELAMQARAEGVRVLWGRAAPRAAEAYRAWSDALLPAAGDVRSEPAMQPWLGALRPVLPGLGGVDRNGAEVSSVACAEAVLRLLAQVSAGTGLVLVLEDLHWADPDTLAMLDFVTEGLGREWVVCLATFRPAAGAPIADSARRLREAGLATVVTLSRLTDAEVAEMVNACAVRAPAEVLDRARSSGDGVPLLIEELVFSATSAATLADSVRGRLSELDQPGLRVLTGAAMLGRRFDWRRLAPSCGVAAEDVASYLAAAMGTGLLVSDEQGFAFRHDLLRDAVLEIALPTDRAPLAAALLASFDSAELESDTGSVDIAADLALMAGDRDRAARLRLAAGRASLRRGALATAIVTLRQTADLLPDSPLRGEADLLLLEALAQAGRFDEAWRIGERLAHDLAARGADPHERLVVHLRLGSAAVAATRWREARAESRAAHRLLDGALPNMRAEQLLLDAEIAIGEHHEDEARGLALEVRDLDAVSASSRCHALEILGRTSRMHDPGGARAVFEEALHGAESAGLPMWRLRALHQIGTVDMFEHCGRTRLEEALRVAKEIGALSTAAVVNLQLCAVEHGRFDLDRGITRALEALDLADRLGLTEVRYKSLLFGSALYALRLDWDRAGEMRDRAMEGRDGDTYSAAFGLGAFALGELLDDRRDDAFEHLEQVVGLLEPLPDVEPATFRAMWPLLLAVREDDRAPAAIANARAHGVGVFAVNTGLLTFAEAVVWGGSGAPDQADRTVAAASPSFENCMFWLHLARVVVADRAEQDGWGHPARWRTAAAREFESRGLTRLAARARPAGDRGVELTRRERDVLDQVAEGLSNREIAQRLSISPRTVEKHVENLLRKTNARSRTQLVVQARDRSVT